MPTERRLPTEVQTAIAMIEHVALGFDRYRIWLDTPMPELPVKAIEQLGAKLVIKPNRSVQHQPLWQCQISVHQPTEKASQLLADAIQDKRYRTRPDYAEVAADYITSTRADADGVRDFFLAHMLVPHMRVDVVCEEGTTFYYHRRANETGGKAPHVPVIYSDRKSKLAGDHADRRCCHLEHRFSGSAALSQIGIACMADMAAFSHAMFWGRQLKLARLPAKAELGRFLAPEKSDCSGTALRKRAEKFLAPFHVQDRFVLQNLRRAHPRIDRILLSLEHSVLPDGVSV